MDQHEVMNAGVDYVTVSGRASGNALSLERWASDVLAQKRIAGERVRPAIRFGFRGHCSDHLFSGSNETGSVVIISGPECVPLAGEAITRSDNVSRLDLQTTVWCHGEQPHLGCELYSRTRARYAQSRTKRTCGLLQMHPKGQTFTLGKRISDCYGRVYDKATEAHLGPPRTVWRYEFELKRKVAQRLAHAYVNSGCSSSWVTAQVHSLYSVRGVDPTFRPASAHEDVDLCFLRAPSARLRWFRESVRPAVATAIKTQGLGATLKALGLDHLLNSELDQQEGHNER